MATSKAYRVGNKPNEVVSVVDFGAIEGSTGDSFADALQTIVDASGQPESTTNPNTVKILIPNGTWWLTKPVYIDALDGLEFVGDNIFGTTIKIPAGFTAGAGTVPGTFPSDGLDYTTASCFVFARRRHTGKSGTFLTAGAAAAAGAPWWYKFSNLYLDLTAYSTGKSADFIRAPEIANLMLEDIVINGGRHAVHTDDALGMYSSVFKNVKMFYGSQFLKANRGTSLLVDQCAAVNCDYGFVSGTSYTTYNSSTVDNQDATGNYCWDLTGEGVVLNGCGCEYPKGGIFRASDRDTTVTVNGGFLLGGANTGDPNFTSQTSETDFGLTAGNMILVTEGARVTFNNTTMRNCAGTTHLKCTARNGGRVIVIGNGGENSSLYVQPEDWQVTGFKDDSFLGQSEVDFVGDNAKASLATTADYTITQNSTFQITFTSSNFERRLDRGPSYFTTIYGLYPRSGTSVTEYRVPHCGIYRVSFTGYITDVDPGDYIYINVTGETNRIITVADTAGDWAFHIEEMFRLAPGDIIKLYYRSFSVTTDPVLKSGARFTVASV